MKFAFFGYRNWVGKILEDLKKNSVNIDSYTIDNTEYTSPKGSTILTNPKDLSSIEFDKYTASFFYGWSWMVSEKVVNKHDAICLHPSPLPKYRGGSPIQHQIINGERDSAVTLFKMDDGLDSGPIYQQKRISLEGSLSDIFSRTHETGSELTLKLISDYANGTVKGVEQNHNQATIYKRRKPHESEITPEMLSTMNSQKLHNFIRALHDPYPNAYIVGRDGNKVYLTESHLGAKNLMDI